jgi:glutamine amidotransferase
MRVCLLDLGLGNMLSLRRGLERAGAEVLVVNDDKGGAADADAVVLPGVGGFRDGAVAIGRFGSTMDEVRKGKPLLGICLGMQLLFSKGFEGGEFDGLGLIDGDVVRLPPSIGIKIPHMGWNSVNVKGPSRLLNGAMDGQYFYFVHSYYCEPREKEVVVAECDYGITMPAVVEKGNIFGTQFHPEKSGRAGLDLMMNFLEAAKR